MNLSSKQYSFWWLLLESPPIDIWSCHCSTNPSTTSDVKRVIVAIQNEKDTRTFTKFSNTPLPKYQKNEFAMIPSLNFPLPSNSTWQSSHLISVYPSSPKITQSESFLWIKELSSKSIADCQCHRGNSILEWKWNRGKGSRPESLKKNLALEDKT